MERTCAYCTKPFYVTTRTDSPSSKKYCSKLCRRRASNDRHSSYRQERRLKPEVKERERDGARYRKYRISPEDYAKLLELQNGHCALCPRTDNLGIDHDHSCCPKGTKKLCGKCNRGLLCNWCNRMIGLIEGDWGVSAIEYIARWAA